jgi:ATP-dependent DNA helicase RecG
MNSKDKEEAMMKFKNGQYCLLVSTTVIEVGVDIPEATIMIIKNAERF